MSTAYYTSELFARGGEGDADGVGGGGGGCPNVLGKWSVVFRRHDDDVSYRGLCGDVRCKSRVVRDEEEDSGGKRGREGCCEWVDARHEEEEEKEEEERGSSNACRPIAHTTFLVHTLI
ncbi:hypothetical protein M0802_003979 [Mischocyttarus mexicanus]|nr:hypothetical protein M0802_003979 [Mischocyttarus mexicanus]